MCWSPIVAWRVRFGLRLLFISIAACSVGAAFVGARVQYFKRQQVLQRELAAHDMYVRMSSIDTDPLTSWLLGGEHFRVYEIELKGGSIDSKLATVAALSGLELQSVSADDGGSPRPHLGIAGIEALSEFDKLTSLSLLFADISDEALRHLDRIPNLESLVLPDSIRDNDVGKMPVLRALESLQVNNAYITDACIDDLCKHPKLGRLTLENTAITEQGIARLQERLPGCRVTGNPFTKQAALQVLATVIEAFKAGEIQAIAASSPHLHDADFKLLMGIEGIEELAFSGAWVRGEALLFVSTPDALQALDLAHCPLTVEGVEHIKRFKSLRRLNLSYTRVNSETIVDLLKHLPNLRELELTNCPVDNTIVPPIMSLPNLTEVWLDGTEVSISDDMLEVLGKQKPDLLLIR